MRSKSATTTRRNDPQSQSQDSLLSHIRSHQKKKDSKKMDNHHCQNYNNNGKPEAANKDNNKKPAAATTCSKVAELWQTVDRELRSNIGTSVRCGICLSTLQQPVRTPCVHAFCKDCIAASLFSGNKKCPECNTPITKRSLQPFEYLQDLCDAYKWTLREFGMVPTKYTPNFTTMTQKVCHSPSHGHQDEDDLSPGDQLDRLDVATAWQQKALPLLVKKKQIQQLQVEENNQVVEANFKACKDILVPKNKEQQQQQLNSTQEVLEQAREQQWADEAWKQQEEEEQKKAKKEQGLPSQDSSVFLTAPEESQGSLSANKRVSFSSKPPTNLQEQEASSSSSSSDKAPNLAVHTSHASEDTEVPAEEDIITPKLTNVTFTKANTDTPANLAAPSQVAASKTKRDSTLFASSLSPIDMQASQEVMLSLEPKEIIVAPVSEHTMEESELTNDPVLLNSQAASQQSKTTPPPNVVGSRKKKTKKGAKSKVAREKENAKTSSTQESTTSSSARQSSRRSRRLAKDEQANHDSVSLSMPTPSPPPPQDEDDDDDEIMSHNDTEESEELPKILEQGTQMTQDEDAVMDTTAKAMMEDSFGALHLLPVKRKKKKKKKQGREGDLSQSSQVSDDDDEEIGDNKAAEGDAKGNSNVAKNKSSQTEEDEEGKNDVAEKKSSQAEEDEEGNNNVAEKKSSQTEDPTDDDCTLPIKTQSPDSIRTRESPVTEPKPTKKVARKRTSFGTATTTRFGAAVAQVEVTTISLNQEDAPLNQEEEEEEEEEDRKVAACPTITPRRRRRRNSNPSENNADEEVQNTVSATEVLATPEAIPATLPLPRVWNVGEIVKVQPRTWPGVNKLGGVARVSKVWETAGNYSYDVTYILGGKEGKVDAIFVVASDDFDDESQPQQRRRRKADATELPMSVLQALENDGFDTTGNAPLKTPHVKRNKRPRLAPKGALKDSTNNKEAKKKNDNGSTTKKTATTKNKRKADSSNTQETTITKKATTSKKKRKADGSDTQETKAVKKVAKKAKENFKTESKSDEAKLKGAPSKTAGAKTKPARARAAKKQGMNPIASMSLPEIFVKADDHYESIMDSAQRDEELYIVTSSLKEEEMSMLREVCSKSLGNIRLRLTETFSKRTKVCVLPVVETEDNIMPQNRTVKAVRSALAGIPMVPLDWITQMKSEKKFVIPKTFVRSLPAKVVPGKKGGVAQYAAGIKSKQNLILKGTFVFLCGSFPDAQRKDMQLVAKEAGAAVLKTPQQVVDQLQQSKRVVVLCQNSSIAPASLEKQLRKSLIANPQAALVVAPGWLFDSIASVEALPPKDFPPSEGKQRNAIALWKLCCNDG